MIDVNTNENKNKTNQNIRISFRLFLVLIVVSGAESFSIVGYSYEYGYKRQEQQQLQQRQIKRRRKPHRQLPTGAATRCRLVLGQVPGHGHGYDHGHEQGLQACTYRLIGDAYAVSKKDIAFKRNNCIELGRTRTALLSVMSLSANDNDNDNTSNPDSSSSSSSALEKRLSMFTLLTPLWTILAAGFAVWNASWCSTVVGSLSVMQTAYAILMFAMGLSITPKDLTRALWRQPKLLSINAMLCFGMMPLLAAGIAKMGSLVSSSSSASGGSGGAAIGLILLGSVSGGQASNLFTLIAGGDVALSVICTISTTLLGVLATPFLVQLLLGCSVAVDGRGVLKSILSLVLVPLFAGSAISRIFQDDNDNDNNVSSNFFNQTVSPFLPTIGVLSTLVLVAGGSSNSIASLSTTKTTAAMATTSAALGTVAAQGNTSLASILLPSCLLSTLGGAIALWIANRNALQLEERTKRTLVIETLSKSPTLAYILALKHFGSDVSVATIPGAAMVTLAVIGALVASIWGYEMRSRKTEQA